jgi:hypothetical protein
MQLFCHADNGLRTNGGCLFLAALANAFLRASSSSALKPSAPDSCAERAPPMLVFSTRLVIEAVVETMPYAQAMSYPAICDRLVMSIVVFPCIELFPDAHALASTD